MEMGGEQSIRSGVSKARLWCLALPVLIVAYFGLRNALVKPGLPFSWAEQGRAVLIRSVHPDVRGLQPGDTLAAVSGFPIRHDHDVEFALDEARKGDVLKVSIRRGGRAEVFPVATVAWYGLNLILINLLFGL
ncbi:MAG TPA: hypothetical protein VGB38_07225, partial [bacterium]